MAILATITPPPFIMLATKVRPHFQDCHKTAFSRLTLSGRKWHVLSHVVRFFAIRYKSEKVCFDQSGVEYYHFIGGNVKTQKMALIGFQDRRNRPLCHLSVLTNAAKLNPLPILQEIKMLIEAP